MHHSYFLNSQTDHRSFSCGVTGDFRKSQPVCFKTGFWKTYTKRSRPAEHFNEDTAACTRSPHPKWLWMGNQLDLENRQSLDKEPHLKLHYNANGDKNRRTLQHCNPSQLWCLRLSLTSDEKTPHRWCQVSERITSDNCDPRTRTPRFQEEALLWITYALHFVKETPILRLIINSFHSSKQFRLINRFSSAYEDKTKVFILLYECRCHDVFFNVRSYQFKYLPAILNRKLHTVREYSHFGEKIKVQVKCWDAILQTWHLRTWAMMTKATIQIHNAYNAGIK